MTALRTRSLVVTVVVAAAAAAWLPAAAAAPTPSPGSSPSPSPSALPSPVPSVAPAPGPSPSPSTSAVPSPGASPAPSPSASPAPVTLPPGGPAQLVLAASSLQLGAIQSLAITSIATPAGPANVIELVVPSSAIGGLDLQLPCAGHSRTRIDATRARFTGGLTLDLTALQVTVGGVAITISVTSPPSLQLLPPAGGTFLSAKLQLLSIKAGDMALDQATIASGAC
jgi:hypothetical protein